MTTTQIDTRVLDASMDACVAVDAAGRIVRWNRAAEQIFGWSAAEVTGRELSATIVPPHLRSAHRSGFTRFARGAPGRIHGGRTETVGQRADGTTFPVELTITRVVDEEGGVGSEPMFVGFLRDITERQRMLTDLRESRARLLKVSDETRRRLERDLHDGAQQQLVGLALSLAAARRKLEVDPAAGGRMLDESTDILASAIDELRELARGVHNAILTGRGLGAAINHLARRSPIDVEPRVAPFDRLPPVVESSVYFLVAEALTNATKYGAKSVAVHVWVDEQADGPWLLCMVTDDGPGGADPAKGTGLAGLDERLRALDGTLKVDSAAGRGTTLLARVPLVGADRSIESAGV